MATLTEKPSNKYQGFIRERLEHTLRRIRLVDLATGLLGLLAMMLAYLAGMISLDVLFRLEAGTRQVFTLFFLCGAAAYSWFFVVRPLRREINPHYAARQLEKAVGPGRHHVVNWIDLENESLAAVYRATLDRRAARDLEQVDPEQAVPARTLFFVGGLTAGLVLGLIVLFLLLGPGPFAAYFSRAWGRTVAIPPRTQIELLRPEGGDTTVTIGNPVTFVVKIHGYRPQENGPEVPTLHWWNEAAPTPRTRALRLSGSEEWSTTLGPLEVGNGFWYHLTAGDAQTADYRVRVRASAHLSAFRARYRYRPYLNLPEKIRTVRAIEEVRGTEVILEGQPNREVREATLEWSDQAGKITLQRGEITPQGLRWRLVLDQPGSYRLGYVATTGEAYRDSVAYPVSVLADRGPQIRFTEPAKDVTLPLNGSLRLQAEIRDDIGIAAVTLKVKRVEGPELPELPYLAGKLGTATYGTPRELSYQEVLIPQKLDESLRPGTVLEYWLEARDGCDFPQANTALSERFRITLSGPGDAAAARQTRQQQQQEKAAHDQRQEEGLKQEKAQRDEQNLLAGAADAQEPSQPSNDRPGGNSGASPPQDPREEDLERQADKLREALQKKQGQQGKTPDAGQGDQPGDEKPGDGKPGEGKPDQPGAASPPKPGQSKDDNPDKPGEAKAGQGEQPGQSKGGSNADNGADSKDPGKDDGTPGKAESKPGSDPQAANQPGNNKQPSDPTAKGQAKGPGQNRPGEQPAQSKPGEAQPGSEGSGAGQEGQPHPAARPDPQAGEAKPGAPAQPDPNHDPKGQGKPSGPPEGQNDAKPGQGSPPPEAQPAEGKPGENPAGAKADSKPGSSKPSADMPPNNPPQSPNDGAGQSKGAGAAADGQAGQGKDGMDPAGMGQTGKGPAPTPPPADMPPAAAAKPEKPDGRGTAPGEADSQPGTTKTAGGSGPGRGNGAESPPARRERPVGSRATQLQLEEFRKAVGEDVLKDAQMSREQFERFLKEYAALAERRRLQEEERDNVRPGQPGTLPSSGGIQSSMPLGPDQLPGASRPKPPSEYRDAYADFLRRLR